MTMGGLGVRVGRDLAFRRVWDQGGEGRRTGHTRVILTGMLAPLYKRTREQQAWCDVLWQLWTAFFFFLSLWHFQRSNVKQNVFILLTWKVASMIRQFAHVHRQMLPGLPIETEHHSDSWFEPNFATVLWSGWKEWQRLRNLFLEQRISRNTYNNGMHSSNADTGQHHSYCFVNHWHVDRYSVTLLHT